MSVLVDTNVWSKALRLKSKESGPFLKLLESDQVVIIGPIRQEILSGIKDLKMFNRLKKHLAAFPDLPLLSYHFEVAAEYFNKSRSRGIQGSHIDFLICAVSIDYNCEIYTLDKDFTLFADFLPIKLHNPMSLT